MLISGVLSLWCIPSPRLAFTEARPSNSSLCLLSVSCLESPSLHCHPESASKPEVGAIIGTITCFLYLRDQSPRLPVIVYILTVLC